jgi:protein-disulfide isomerase
MISKLKLFLFFPLIALVLASCASESQIKAVLEKHPEILFSAIEKNPEKFMDTVQKAAQMAQRKSQEDAEKEEKARVENELKNPLKPDLPADRAYKGPANAPITVVEYSDFQCPFCQRGFKVVEQIVKAYPTQVRFIFKNLPLPMHPMAMPASQRFEAIALQDAAKAYKFHDEVFKNQQKLNGPGAEKFMDDAAKKVGADLAKMKKDMESDQVKARIDADMAEAEKFGISGTPGFVVEGVSVRGAYPFETFKEIIDKKLAAKK